MRAVARWVKNWAESVLTEDTLSPWERDGVRVVPPPPPSREPDPNGPPEHWRRLMESKRRGPPADWVERVRRGAPHLLADLEPQPAPSVAPMPMVPPAPVATLPTPVPSTVPVPSPTPVLRTGRAPPARLTRHEAPRTAPPPPRVETQATSFEVGPTPLPVPRADVPVPEPKSAPPRSTVTPEVPRSTRGRGFALRPLPETSTSTVSPGPVSAVEPRPERSTPVPPGERSPMPGDARPAFVRPVPPSPHAPFSGTSDARVPSRAAEPVPREAPVPRAPSRTGPSSAPEVSAHSAAPHPWPEPPALPSIEPSDPLTVLRDWERLRRLEREQRGE